MDIKKIAEVLCNLAYDMEFEERSENYEEELNSLIADLQELKSKESVLFNCLDIIALENEL